MATLNKFLISRILESCFRFLKVKAILVVNEVLSGVQNDWMLGIVGYGREKRCMLKNASVWPTTNKMAERRARG